MTAVDTDSLPAIPSGGLEDVTAMLAVFASPIIQSGLSYDAGIWMMETSMETVFNKCRKKKFYSENIFKTQLYSSYTLSYGY